jgi:hypothetical protein
MIGGEQTTTLGSCPTAVCNPAISPNTNKLISTGYILDAAGNTFRCHQQRKDNIVEVGFDPIDTHEGDASGVAFGIAGETFDRMANIRNRLALLKSGLVGGPQGRMPALWGGSHEFGAHLLSGGHSSNPNSLFYGGGGLDYGTQFGREEIGSLVSGVPDPTITPPQTPASPTQAARPHLSPIDALPPSGSAQVWANSRDNSSPASVFR